MQPAVNNHNQRAYSPAILIGDNSTDPRAFLIEQAGPGGEGVVTIHWDNSSRPNSVLASEVILLTAETHPPDNIPPGGGPRAGQSDVEDVVADSGNVGAKEPCSKAKNLFGDSEAKVEVLDNAPVAPMPEDEPQEAADDEGWGRPRPPFDNPIG